MKDDWNISELSQVSRVFTDGNWIETKDQAADGIRLIQTGNIGEGLYKDRSDKARYINDHTFDRLNCFEVLPGDCLISRLPDPVGRACIVPNLGLKMITAVDCSIFRPDKAKIDINYFVYFTQSRGYLYSIDQHCTGTTRRRISRKNLGKVPIPLPPLKEQRRIVAVLNEAFESLGRARAHAEANLEDAEQLFKGSVTDLFAHAGNAVNWVPVGSVCKLENGDRGKNYPGRKAFVPYGVPFINAGHLKDGLIDWSAMNYIPEERFHQLSNGKTRANDVLFCLRGSLGKFAKVDYTGMAAIASSLIIVRCREKIIPDFLAAYFSSSVCAVEIEKFAGGAAQPNLSAKSLSAFRLPLLEIKCQKDSCLSMKVRSPMPCSCSCLSPTRSQRRRRELHGADSDMAQRLETAMAHTLRLGSLAELHG